MECDKSTMEHQTAGEYRDTLKNVLPKLFVLQDILEENEYLTLLQCVEEEIKTFEHYYL